MNLFLKKLILFSIWPLVLLIFIMLYNFYIDPFGVINGNLKVQYTEPNQHYLKIKHVLNNPQKYNAFLFGNSRVGKINVSKINDKNNWYNMSYSEGLPYEHLQDVKIFLKHGVKINRIIIGIDEISCFISPEKHKNESLRKPYVNSFNPFLYYLTLKPSYSLYKVIKKEKEKKFASKSAYETIYNNGSFFPNMKDKYIEQNHSLHIQDSIFNTAYWSKYNYPKNISSAIESLEEIVNLCKKHQIELLFFVNPMFAETYKKAVNEGFLCFIEQVARLKELYDFSGINELTENKLNYYENSHYRPIIGDMIAKELTNTNSRYFVNKMTYKYWLEQKKNEAARTHNILYK